MSARASFIRDERLALFLEVDGTLLEIAATPDRVRVPASLRNTLQLSFEREHGALALLSGRSLDDLDELFSPATSVEVAPRRRGTLPRRLHWELPGREAVS